MLLSNLMTGLYWHFQSLPYCAYKDLSKTENIKEIKVQLENKYDVLLSDENLQLFEKEIQWLKSKGIHILRPWEENYPLKFKLLKRPPLLTAIGNIQILNENCLAVVGSRQPSQMALDWMRRDLDEFLKSEKVILVSGGARGIDQEAHRLCIANKIPTICFLPSGLAKVYPNNLIAWFEPILKSRGVIVSQFSPFTQLYKCHFHFRNELIAYLSNATFVVEAKQRSGSILTAQKALHHGKEIATLPCSPANSFGRGSLQLLREGAQMITDSLDLKTFWSRNQY